MGSALCFLSQIISLFSLPPSPLSSHEPIKNGHFMLLYEITNSVAGLGTGAPIIESPYGDPVNPEDAPESISRAVASLPPEQMFELMKQMKVSEAERCPHSVSTASATTSCAFTARGALPEL